MTDAGLRLERALRADPMLQTEIAGYFEDVNRSGWRPNGWQREAWRRS